MKFELFARRTWKGRRWYFRIKAKNGEIVAQSEGYHNRSDALHTIKLIRDHAPNAVVTTLV